MKAAPVLAILLLPALAGCHVDFLDTDHRNFEGFYSYAGTVDDAAGDAVIGDFTITRQRGDRAQVAIDWIYLDNGEEIIHITTDSPAIADIDSDGRIYFEFEGNLITDDGTVHFRLEHDGRLRNRTMTGFWRLVTGLPTDDTGTFTAHRE